VKLKLVVVDVLDISTRAGWWDYNRKNHHREQTTMPVTGFMVDRTDDFIILAASHNRLGGDWLNEVTIPAALVKRVRVLELTEV